jgi:type IV pilus assembly protein PilN
MIRINLLPIKQLQAEVTRKRELITAGIVLGSTLVILIGSYLYQWQQLTSREQELAGLRAELQTLTARVKEVADLQVKLKDLRAKQKIIEDLNNKKTGPALVMASLSGATPASLWLTDLQESGGNLSMSGLAADNETIAAFMKALANSSHFENVDLVETTQGVGLSATLKKFAIKARALYRGGTPAEAKGAAPSAKQENKS